MTTSIFVPWEVNSFSSVLVSVSASSVVSTSDELFAAGGGSAIPLGADIVAVVEAWIVQSVLQKLVILSVGSLVLKPSPVQPLESNIRLTGTAAAPSLITCGPHAQRSCLKASASLNCRRLELGTTQRIELSNTHSLQNMSLLPFLA